MLVYFSHAYYFPDRICTGLTILPWTIRGLHSVSGETQSISLSQTISIVFLHALCHLETHLPGVGGRGWGNALCWSKELETGFQHWPQGPRQIRRDHWK